MTRLLSSTALSRDFVPDGSVIGIGGAGLTRKPMQLLRDLLAAGARDLEVVSFLGSVDVELLIAAGAVRRLHTAGVGLDGFGLAPAYRAARQDGTIEVIGWSEGSLAAALEAASRGVPSFPCGTAPGSDTVTHNRWLGVFPDPHTGEETVFARALRLDVALLHVPTADARGNLHVTGDAAVDGLMARAAGVTVASAESAASADDPAHAAISRVWVDAVVEAPAGAWPTECPPHHLVDLAAVGKWAGSDGTNPELLEPRS